MSSSTTKLSLIKDIETIFSEINNKIDSLNNCSSQDFTQISQSFSNFHSEIQKVSANTNDIFEYIGNDKKQNYNTNLQNVLEKGKDLFEKLGSIFPFFNTIDNQHPFSNNNFFVHYNNLRQDLNTLHLFLAKCRLSESAATNGDINPQLINTISTLDKRSNEFIENINSTIEKLRAVLKDLHIELKSNNFNTYFKQNYKIDQFDKIATYYNNKDKEASKELSTLKEKEISASESFSNIITNLQYHDIIRQKIEHIQFAHKQAFDDLTQYRQQHENTVDSSPADSIGHIADIADLQAAHLLEANKEYQNAIKIIIDKLNNLSETVRTTSELGKVFVDNKNTYYYNTLFKIKELINNNGGTIGNNISITDNLIQILNNCISFTDNIQDEISGYKSMFAENIDFLIENTSSKTLHLEKLKQEINSNLSNLENYFFSIVEVINTGKGKEIQDILTQSLNSSTKSFNTLFDDLTTTFLNIDKELRFKITENISLSHNISLDIQKSIKGVQFYDYFEQVVGETILALDDIGNKLLSLGFSTNHDSEKLDLIKKMYTMASERQIHNTTLNNYSVDDIDDDDDIELF